MTKWIRYTLPAAAIVSVASPAHAMQYLSIEEAQKQAFPSATHFTEVQAGRVWEAEAGGRVAGFFIFDRVIGKHLYIDYAVALTPRCGAPRRDPAVSGILWGRDQEPELACPVCRQDERQFAQDQWRYQEHRRRYAVVNACHGGCEEGIGSLWQPPQIGYAAPDHCSGPLWRSKSRDRSDPGSIRRSMPHSRRFPAFTG